MVQMDYDRRRKSKAVGYLAWLFLGWHYLYLRRIGLQFAFWVTAGGFLIWWFIDLFRVGPIINRMNEDLARDLITQYHSIYREPERAQMAIFQAPALAPMLLSAEPVPAMTLSNRTVAYDSLAATQLDHDDGSYIAAKDGFLADGIKLIVMAGAVIGILYLSGVFLSERATEQVTSQNAELGVSAAYRTTGLANVRSGPYAKSDELGSLEPGAQFDGVAEVGPNGVARWVRISDGTYTGGYVSAVNLKTEN